MGALENSAIGGVWRQCLMVNVERIQEQYKDTSMPKRSLTDKVLLRVNIAQATLGFKSELHNFMRELKQETRGKTETGR